MKVMSMEAKPSRQRAEPQAPRHLGIDMECRYIPKAVQVMSDRISKGSHDQ